MLESLGGETTAGVLVGLENPDDGAVYALEGGEALVATLDFFTPIVDDPYSFGAIAAANALSDIYAMGGRPLFALNIVAFPIEELDRSILAEILRGGQEKANEAGVAIVGGHSIDDKEPKYGMVVVGLIDAERIYRKGDGRAGDRIVLTKAIGTGVISTAIKKGTAPEEAVSAAIESMSMLNDKAAQLAARHDIGAVTDVTGYGLLGHLAEVARFSGLSAIVEVSSVPILPHVRRLADESCIAGGTRRNHAFVDSAIRWPPGISEEMQLVLCDAQTSGGLLISVDPAESATLVDELRDQGYPSAEIGELVAGPAGEIEVRDGGHRRQNSG